MWGWVQIRSWHVAKTATRVPNSYITMCGKRAVGDTLPTFPPSEKTCETCLRLSAKATSNL